ncbi:MAG TPA: AI-2E family transporter [Acidimicrobiales bacterium]|nr:AI-2E family transporter [Acidimicrobiales bacterium]
MSSPPPSPVPGWLASSTAYAWRVLVLGAVAYIAAIAFGRLELIIVPVVAALFFSTVLVPPARWLRRHGLPPLAATWVVFLAALLVVAGIVGGLVPSISGEFSALGKELSKGLTTFQHWLENGFLHLSHRQVTNFVDSAKKELNTNRAKLIKGALSGVTLVLQGAGATLLTMVLTFFFVKDGEDIGNWALGLAAESRAPDLRAVGSEAWATLGGYVRGTAANGAVNAVLISIGLLGLGVPLVAPIAVLTFVGGFLPLVGAIAAGLTAALVALVAKGFVAALIVVGMTVVIHNIEGYLVGPLVLGRAVKLHPIAVLLALTIGTILGGIIGAFLAVPATAVALAVNEHYRIRRRQALAATPAALAALELPGSAVSPEEAAGQ